MRGKFVRAVLTGLWIGCVPAALADDLRDGSWWNRLTRTEKDAYVLGYADGFLKGGVAYDAQLVVSHQGPNPEDSRVRDGAVKNYKEFKGQYDKDFGELAAGQLVSGVDSIYADYRNSRIVVAEAVTIVDMGINGMSDAEMNVILVQARKDAAP